MDSEERIISILSYMAKDKTPHRVTEVSKELGITKSSVCRILMSLERFQWVAQLPTDEYVLGDKVLEFSAKVLSGYNIRNLCYPYLEELNYVTKETVGLVVRIGTDEHTCIDQIESNNLVRHVLSMGNRHPLWKGATGKAILANLDKNEINSIFRNLKHTGQLLLASGKMLEIDDLKKELAEIRRTGYAISIGELTEVTAAVAAPIFVRNKVTAGIIITGPLPRFNEKIARDYGQLVSKTAQDISIRLGSTS